MNTFVSLDSMYGMAAQSDGKLIAIGQADTINSANLALARFNSDGSLDRTFGDRGRVVPVTGSTTGIGRAVTIQSDGKIIGAGETSSGGFDGKFTILRLNSDGTPDVTFNGTGSRVFDDLVGVPYDVMVQIDGKILLTGAREQVNSFVVIRLNEDGSLDTSFGSSGVASIGVRGYSSSLLKKASFLQQDGKVVVCGTISSGSTYPLALVRFNPDGTQDPEFGDKGSTIIELDGYLFRVGGISRQIDGKIVVSGAIAENNGWADFATLRFSPDGMLDTSFGDQGKVITSTSSGVEEVNAVAINSEGKIIAGGCRQDILNTPGRHHTFVQYDQDGDLDPSFGIGGVLKESISGISDCARALLIEPDNNIRAGGYRADFDSEFSILSLKGDGTRQQAFSSDGLVSVYLGEDDFASERVNAMAVQRDGKTVVSVHHFQIGNFFAVARFDLDGSLDPKFDGDGRAVFLPPSGYGLQSSGSANAIAMQTDGKILAAGNARNLTTDKSEIVVMRLLTDGSPDPSFGANGTVVTRPVQRMTIIRSIAIQPDGRIIVAGETGPDLSNRSMMVVRYGTDGTLDPTFGSGGIVITSFSAREGAHSVAVQADGRIVVSGYSTVIEFGSGAVMRLNTDGSLDASFGQGGIRLVSIGFIASAIQPDGKILLLVNLASFGVLRLNSDGSSDLTFGEGGGMTTVVGVNSTATSMALQGDGKILIAGFSRPTELGLDSFTLVRYDSSGHRDLSFNGNGIVTTPLGNDATQAYAVAIQPDGKIVAGGRSFSSETMQDIAVARYFSGYSPLRASLFDYDGDGKTDISVFRPATGDWYLNRSTAGFLGMSFGTLADHVAPADYDGDGRTDLAVYRPSTGIWYVTNSSDSSVSYFVFGIEEDLPTPADYDGDGNADISVFRPSTGTWYRTNSSDGSFATVQFGQDGDRPTIGDFDGDGKADVAVFRPSTGVWYQSNSSDGSFFGEQFGNSTDKIAPADYDGDGKTDIAIYRPSEGLWYYKNSAHSTYTPYVFGLTGDIPVAGDYDGDGKADIAVFRPADGYWYIVNSANGSFTIFPWGQKGDRPTPAAFGN